MNKDSTPDLPSDPLLTLPEVGRLLRISRASLYRHVRDGKLPVVRIGGRLRMRRVDFARVVELGL